MLCLCDVLTFYTLKGTRFKLLLAFLCVVGFSKERFVIAVKPLEMWCDVGKLLSALQCSQDLLVVLECLELDDHA